MPGALPAAVGFNDASWNPTEPAEVDATDASLSEGEVTFLSLHLGRRRFRCCFLGTCICSRFHKLTGVGDVAMLSCGLRG